MVDGTERAWIDAAEKVAVGVTDGLDCPENCDDALQVTWMPGPIPALGEYELHCPSCQAVRYLRVTRVRAADEDGAISPSADTVDDAAAGHTPSPITERVRP